MRGVRVLLCGVLACAAARADDVKVWPLFYRNTDPETRTARTELLWPLYTREATPAYTVNQLLSFPHRYPTAYPSQFYCVWPFCGVRTGKGHDIWLFPFLWSGAEPTGNDHHLALFPAFYYGEQGDTTTLNIGLLQHNRWDANGSGHYLWPLLWKSSYQSAERDDSGVGVLPLFWLDRDRYTGSSQRSRSNSGGVLLLSWWHRSASTNTAGDTRISTWSSDGLFPLYHRTRSVESSEGRVRFQRSADSLWVIPYRESHKARTDSAGTFASSRHALYPLYWSWHVATHGETDAGKLLFPLWWHASRRNGERLEESADFVVPIGAHLYKRGVYETRNLLGPVFNRTENELTHTVRYDILFPFLSRTLGAGASGGRLFPLFGWHTEQARHANLWYLFPFGWRCESQEDFEYRLGQPQFWALHELETRPLLSETDCRRGPRRTVALLPFYWSRRQADAQSSAVLPFYWQNTHRWGACRSRDTFLPLLLGAHETAFRDDVETSSRQSYLLTLIAHGSGEQYRQWRVFPLFSYERSGGSLDVGSFLLLFAYESWRDPERPETAYNTELSIPFSFLPLYRSASHRDATGYRREGSWLFPFYKRGYESRPEGEVSKLSVLWPIWNGEWQNDEARVRGLGGVVNFYERDANGFVEQRWLYRVFTRQTRSWYSQCEVMPFYARKAREDGRSSWGVLGGLVGGGCDGARDYLRLFYVKIPTGAAPAATPEALAARQSRHAELALSYLRHGRHDRAAIEFALAGGCRDGDVAFQLAAAEAYLKAEPDALGKELRSSIPDGLDGIIGKTGGSQVAEVRRNLRSLSVQHFENALRLGADKPATLRKLAEAHTVLGQQAEALAGLTEADRLSPGFTSGMLRFHVAVAIWRAEAARPKDQAVRLRETFGAAQAVLAELKGRYPGSPSLALAEADLPAEAGQAARSWAPHMYISDQGAFGAESTRRLALLEAGAQGTAGAEEQAWLQAATSGGVPACWSQGFWAAGEKTSPEVRCACLAAGVLNRRMEKWLRDRNYAEAAALEAPSLRLLPHSCLRCATPSGDGSAHLYLDPLPPALHNLYALYVTASNRPLAYIALAEGLAGQLCLHQRRTIEQVLEPVRLEQQYIKTWRVAGQVDGKPVEQVYAGAFFERYVDLDKRLGQPDRCTVTATCVVTAPTERLALLRLGFDHTLTATWNGQAVFGPKSRKIAVRDEYRVPVTLKAGENRLRLTVADDTLAYGFFARLSDEAGALMRDVTVAAGPAGAE